MATQQNLSSLRIDDDDGKRDWASLPLDLLRTIASAPQLKRDMASKQAALASCKTVGRAVVQTSSLGGLRLDVDRRAKFVPSVQLWRELWGAEQPQQVQLVGLGLSSRHYGSPGRCWSEVLRAGERLPFVTTLVLQVRANSGWLLRGTSGACAPHKHSCLLARVGSMTCRAWRST